MPDSLDRELDASVCPLVPVTGAAIQPHGCLIAFDNSWQGLRLASANLALHFDLSPAEALGKSPGHILGTEITAALARALAKGAPGLTVPANHKGIASQWRYISLHTTRQLVVLEIEPLEGTGHDWPGLGHTWAKRIANASSVDELNDQLLQALHALTGFESCALYNHAEHNLPSGERSTLGKPLPVLDHLTQPPIIIADSQAKPVTLLGPSAPLSDFSDYSLCHPPPALLGWLSDQQSRAALILDLYGTTPNQSLVICQDYQPCHLVPPLRHLLLQLIQTATLRRTLLHEKQQIQHRYRVLHEHNTRLQRLAYTDPLTQVANRHRIEQVLDTELTMANRNGTLLSVLLFDIDHFKRINDTHGHEIGDRALHRVAQQVQSQLRDSDHLGRWGGEEFIAVIPGCSLSRAQELAWRVCQALAQDHTEPVGRITASFGVATSQPGDTSRKLVKRADHAMYRAKQAGRACVRTQEVGE